jgi:hypothetical protein
MKQAAARDDVQSRPRVLAHAPEELTRTSLRRLGEGVGKVVYASEHWVVKRERSQSEVIALVAIWKMFRSASNRLPGRLGHKLLERPSKRIRLLRRLMQPFVAVVPKSVWMTTHIGEVWDVYWSRASRGQSLANERLAGTSLIPETVSFPPTRVKVLGWPGFLTVSEATERVEMTLYQRLAELAAADRFDEVEQWLERFLALRQSGWRRGVFSVDAHLKNFGVTGERVVLLDAGGLTDTWAEIESRLCFEEVASEPHIQLGLGCVLGARPDLAARFNARWREIVNAAEVRRYWPISA